MTTMIMEIRHPTLPITLRFDDDGRTGYAYLLREPDGIVADVWVYNAVDTPEKSEWKDPSLLPFRNSKSYAKDIRPYKLPSKESDIEVNWSTTDDGRVGGSLVFFGTTVAKLFEGDQPGMSLMASRDGPLARVLR